MGLRGFPKAKKCAVCAQFPLGPKFHFSQWETDFSRFIDKFSKFDEIEYLIHYVKFEM